MKYLYILEIIRSKRDYYGNTYSAFQFTSTISGNYVEGKLGDGRGEEARYAVEELNKSKEVHNCFTFYTDLPIREFNHRIKNWAIFSGVTELAMVLSHVNLPNKVWKELHND